MPAPPIDIKLRCKSWAQVSSMYNRDLTRGALFIRANNPPALGTSVRVQLLLPSQTLIVLGGVVERHIGPGELEGRGPGVDIRLQNVPQSALWLIESALQSAEGGSVARPLPKRPSVPKDAPREAPSTGQVTQPRDLDMNSGALFVSAEHDLIRALSDELESLRGMNAYQVLGVAHGADPGSIRAAFAELTKRYHPDLYTRYQSDRIRALAAEIFIAIRNAYDALDRAAQRRRPAVSPERTPTTSSARAGAASSPATGQRPPVPEQTSTRPVQQASASVRPASAAPTPAQDATASDYERRTGTGYDFLDQGQYSQAHSTFLLARRRNPDDAIIRAGLELAEGMIALEAGDRLEAAQRFEAALQIDPRNQQAAERLAEMRRRATAERKNFLARLMEQRE